MVRISAKARKKPRQKRSQETVTAILDATAQVLVAEGFARLTTNRVAVRAGVSVGSIYQYFPNKEALVVAVSERHGGQVMALLARVMASTESADLVGSIRRFIRAMFAVHAINPDLHKSLTEVVLVLGTEHVSEVSTAARAVVHAYLCANADHIVVTDMDAASFLMVTTVEAVTHAALLDFAGPVDEVALETELVAMLLRYLGVEPSAPDAHSVGQVG